MNEYMIDRLNSLRRLDEELKLLNTDDILQLTEMVQSKSKQRLDWGKNFKELEKKAIK